MIPLHLKKFKSKTPFMLLSALKNFFGFIPEKIRPELVEVQKLVKQLEELPNVEEVRVIRNKSDSSHEMIFQILSHVDSDSRTILVKKAISLAIKTERKLDSIFNVEDWDIGVRVVREFKDIDNHQIVVFTNAKSESEYLRTAS